MREGQPFIPDAVRENMQERSNWGDLLELDEVEPVPAEDRGRWRGFDR